MLTATARQGTAPAVAVEDVLPALCVLVPVALQAVGEQPAARARASVAIARSVVASIDCPPATRPTGLKRSGPLTAQTPSDGCPTAPHVRPRRRGDAVCPRPRD